MARQNTKLSLSATRSDLTDHKNTHSTAARDGRAASLETDKEQQQHGARRKTAWGVSGIYDMAKKKTSAILHLGNAADESLRRHSFAAPPSGDQSGEHAYVVGPPEDNGGVEAKQTSSQLASDTQADGAASGNGNSNSGSNAGGGSKSGEDTGNVTQSKEGVANGDADASSSSSGESESGSSEESGSDEDDSSSGESGSDSSGESGSESSGESGSDSSEESGSDDDSSDDDSGSGSSEESSSDSEEPKTTQTTNTVPNTDASAAGEAMPAETQTPDINFYSQMQTEDLADGQTVFIGPGSAADLMVLDYVSQRILDEVSELGQLLENQDAEAKDIERKFQQLDSLAHEHTLVRRIHFTRELFLGNDERPADEADMVQWAVALHRVNLATFVLLAFRPQVAVVESVGRNIPNRERLLASLGLESAARGFFTHIVPVNRRDDDAIGLLVDIQTQQWLMAANDENHLQSMVAEERQSTDAAIRELLSIDVSGDSDDATVAAYRSEIGRRLNKISGGKLAITRAQYSLHDVWKRVARFCNDCVATMQPPALLSSRLKDRDLDDEADEADDDEIDQVGEQSEHESVRIEEASEPESEPSIAGDFEVTIFTNSVSRKATNRTSEAPVEPESAEPESAEPEISEDAGPIDPSFSEERRLAVVLRDALDDVHLDELMQNIDAEHIETGRNQSAMRTPRRMHVAHSHEGPPPPQPNIAIDNGADDGFQLQFDEEENGNEDEGKQPLRRSKRLTRVRANSADSYNDESESDDEPIRRHGKRPAFRDDGFVKGPEFNPEVADDIVEQMKAPAKRTRIRYGQQDADRGSPGEFRGRRGIAAEDPSELRDDANQERIEFTPSVQGTPEAEDAAVFEELGQYKPLHMEPRIRASENSQPADTQMHNERATQTEQAQPSTQSRGSGRRRRQKHQRWSREEEECFIRAVFDHGPRWSLIEQYHGTNGSVDQVLQGRNRFNLKDKARNIKLRLLRENRPLGPFVHATGHL